MVVIVVEALRADHLSLNGYPRPTSPHLDRLAAEAVVFDRASAPALWCAPAHGSLLTGRWPSFHGAERLAGATHGAGLEAGPRAAVTVDGAGAGDAAADALAVAGPAQSGGAVPVAERFSPLDPDVVTLPEILRREGLRTAAFVGNPEALSPTAGFARGFDDLEAGGELADAASLASRLTSWLQRHPERSFVYASIADARGPQDARAHQGSRPGRIAARDVAPLVARYDDAVATADRAVGEILAALARQGRYRDALVVVTADHGEMLGEHGLSGHGQFPFEPQVRVPLLVKRPGGRDAGQRVWRRVSTMGVFAEVVAAAGATLPGHVQARSLDDRQPVWVEDRDPRGSRLRAGYDGPNRKLVRFAGPTGPTGCAYDLAGDPDELAPDCGPEVGGPLRLALDSFEGRARPTRLRGVARVEAGAGIAEAAN